MAANVVKSEKKSTNPGELLQVALSNGAGLEQLKELMDLQERWEQKEARKSFFDALSRFQSMVPAIPKSKVANITMRSGGAYRYKFADLGTITKTIKKALEECGLAYRWEFQDNNGKLKVTCFVSHRDGHTETTSMEAGLDNSGAKNDIQQKGSTQTYLQRYTLIGALGISTADEDNDGLNHPSTLMQEPGVSEEEYLDQWKQQIEQTRSKIELNKLYISNKKTVDSSDKIRAMFKHHEAKLKASQKESVTLP